MPWMRRSLLFLLAPMLLTAQGNVIMPRQGVPSSAPPAANTPPEQRCVVEGHVVDSQTGEPLKKAAVRLARRNARPNQMGPFGGPAQGYSGTSEADGSFRFEGVEPGDYTLMGERSGFLRTQYGAKSAMGAGQIITLRPSQQLTGLSLALIKQAVISGRVVDDDGDPVGGAMLQALRQVWSRGKSHYFPYRSANSDDQGQFRIFNLQPGKYYLVTSKMNFPGANDAPASPNKPDVRPVRTFYPDALTRDSAAPITVRAGQDASGMDIHLRSSQTYHVRGKVVGNLPDSDTQRVTLQIGPQDEEFPMTLGMGPMMKRDHTFDIAGVAPGSYSLTLSVFGGAFRSFARQTVEVGSSDLNGVVLTVAPSGTIRGQVRVEGTPASGSAQANLTQVRVMLQPAAQGQMFAIAQAPVKSDGSFVLDNVSPGDYYPQAMNGPQGTYLKSIRFGQQEVLGKELDLTQNTAGELQITFRYGPAEVGGTVQTAQNTAVPPDASAPAPSTSVILLPDTQNADGSGMEFSNTNQNGVFSFKRVPPGHYRAVALEQLDPNLLQNPEVSKELASRGVDLDVQENDKKQLQLQVLPAADLQQLLARLGIEEE
jgi:protocatechuate 3,4-dioxygenase beta subunit